MTSILEGLGTEEVVDEAFVIIREKLNDAISYWEAIGNARDEERAERMSIPYVPISIERIPESNFHVGSIPSFVGNDDREDNYPMVVVTAGNTVPSAEDANMDHYNVYQNAVDFHSFAKAMPGEGNVNTIFEEVAWRRAMRMAEAVHHLVHTDPNLKRLVSGVSGPVLVTRSEPWYFPPADGHGEDWCWMAVMHSYSIKNMSTTH